MVLKKPRTLVELQKHSFVFDKSSCVQCAIKRPYLQFGDGSAYLIQSVTRAPF